MAVFSETSEVGAMLHHDLIPYFVLLSAAPFESMPMINAYRPNWEKTSLRLLLSTNDHDDDAYAAFFLNGMCFRDLNILPPLSPSNAEAGSPKASLCETNVYSRVHSRY